jgi:hypothetical protein
MPKLKDLLKTAIKKSEIQQEVFPKKHYIFKFFEYKPLRIKEIAIRSERSVRFFKELFRKAQKFIDANTQLSEQDVLKLDQLLSKKITERQFYTFVATSRFLNEKSQFTEFAKKNPFESEIRQLFVDDANEYRNVIQKINFNGNKIKSVFTDFQAFTICKGLSDSKPRSIAKKYFKKNIVLIEDRYNGHWWAMETKNKYPSNVISKLFSLPELPFEAKLNNLIFEKLDVRRVYNIKPIIRLSFESCEIKKVSISFINCETYGVNTNVVQIKDIESKKVIFKLSRDGFVLPDKNAIGIIPVIRFFMRSSGPIEEAILYYGVQTGNCPICNKELTDPLSLAKGIGPVCGKQHGFL